MTTKDRIVLILAIGLILLLASVMIFDFTLALETGRSPDDNVIELLQMAMTGLIGIVSGYLAGRSENSDQPTTQNYCNKEESNQDGYNDNIIE